MGDVTGAKGLGMRGVRCARRGRRLAACADLAIEGAGSEMSNEGVSGASNT